MKVERIRMSAGAGVNDDFLRRVGRRPPGYRRGPHPIKLRRKPNALASPSPTICRRMNGDKLSVTIVEVNYGPGESSMPHSHPCPVIGYVLEGTLRTQVKGEPEAIYKAGESFYEAPNGVHIVSANASDKVRAKFLAYFVCDQHAPLSVAAPENKPEEEK